MTYSKNSSVGVLSWEGAVVEYTSVVLVMLPFTLGATNTVTHHKHTVKQTDAKCLISGVTVYHVWKHLAGWQDPKKRLIKEV